MVAEFIDVITEWLAGLWGFVESSVTSAVGLFWDSTLNTGAGGFTFVGILAVMGLAFGFLSLGIGFVSGLVRK